MRLSGATGDGYSTLNGVVGGSSPPGLVKRPVAQLVEHVLPSPTLISDSHMVHVAHSVERLVVVEEAAGSKPAAHPAEHNSTASFVQRLVRTAPRLLPGRNYAGPPTQISGAHTLCLVRRRHLLQREPRVTGSSPVRGHPECPGSSVGRALVRTGAVGSDLKHNPELRRCADGGYFCTNLRHSGDRPGRTPGNHRPPELCASPPVAFPPPTRTLMPPMARARYVQGNPQSPEDCGTGTP